MARFATKKLRNPKRSSTKSTFSATTEPSKQPKDLLALGQHLVDELGLSTGVDTLGRWMAHYLAELKIRAESAPSPTSRKRLEGEVVDMVLKIWDRRSTLPGSAYPLNEYSPALQFLDQMTREGLAWFRPPQKLISEGVGALPKRLAVLSGDLARLAAAIALSGIKPPRSMPAAVQGVLSPAERELDRLIRSLYESEEAPHGDGSAPLDPLATSIRTAKEMEANLKSILRTLEAQTKGNTARTRARKRQT